MAATIVNSNATLDDIIFKDRNKSYGAYLLRKTYQRVVSTSAGIGVLAFAAALLLFVLARKIAEAQAKKVEVIAETMNLDTPPPEKKVELPPPPPPPPPKEIPQVTTTKFLPPEIKHDEEVTKPEPPPEEVKGNTATETVKGQDDAVETVVDPDAVKKEEPVEVKPAEDEIFTAVEQQPEFPGGMAAFGKYLQKNLKYPAAASRANVSGKVYVQFVVNTDGSIQDVQILKSLGFGCDEEASRVIKSVPKWSPGKQSGRAVRTKFTLPISFVLE